ncbi:MAG: hypothetical protein AB7G13_20655 [Lautropia sp.]
MSQRRIETTLPEDRVIDDGDMLLRRALPVEGHPSLGPFVFLDHYRHHGRRAASATGRTRTPASR